MDGWAPLHLFFKSSIQSREERLASVQLILDAGAHIDQVSGNVLTPLDLFKFFKTIRDEHDTFICQQVVKPVI